MERYAFKRRKSRTPDFDVELVAVVEVDGKKVTWAYDCEGMSEYLERTMVVMKDGTYFDEHKESNWRQLYKHFSDSLYMWMEKLSESEYEEIIKGGSHAR